MNLIDIESRTPYYFSSQGELKELPDGRAYCFEIVIGGESHYFPAFRDRNSEDLMHREFPGSGYDHMGRYMAVVALTKEEIASAHHEFGYAENGKFHRLTREREFRNAA